MIDHELEGFPARQHATYDIVAAANTSARLPPVLRTPMLLPLLQGAASCLT
jgi:hypothetical protein